MKNSINFNIIILLVIILISGCTLNSTSNQESYISTSHDLSDNNVETDDENGADQISNNSNAIHELSSYIELSSLEEFLEYIISDQEYIDKIESAQTSKASNVYIPILNDDTSLEAIYLIGDYVYYYTENPDVSFSWVCTGQGNKWLEVQIERNNLSEIEGYSGYYLEEEHGNPYVNVYWVQDDQFFKCNLSKTKYEEYFPTNNEITTYFLSPLGLSMEPVVIG